MKTEKGERGQYKVEDDPVISSARRFPFGVDVGVDVAWSSWSFHDDDSNRDSDRDSDSDTDNNELFPRPLCELFASLLFTRNEEGNGGTISTPAPHLWFV